MLSFCKLLSKYTKVSVQQLPSGTSHSGMDIFFIKNHFM